MTKNQQRYLLQILFDSKQVTLEELQEKAENALQEYLPDIDLKVDAPHSAYLQLAIKGTLEGVDACHNKINQIILNQSKLKFVRRLDEAGDEIRQQAYSILSKIEQRFRGFVNQALIEVFGFEWWDNLAPKKIRSKVDPVRTKSHKCGTPLAPLECTQFDDLIEIITAEVSDWSEEQHLCVTDIVELISISDSIAEVRNHLNQKIKKHSLWDVFACYFQDKKQWEKIKKSLNFVIDERHKVMHHRPIHFGTIQALQKKKNELFALLDFAKPELSELECNEAQKEIKYIHKNLTTIGKLIEPFGGQHAQLAAQMKSLIDPSLLEKNSQLVAKIKETIEPFGGQHAQLAAQMKSLIDPSLLEKNSQLVAKIKETIEPFGGQHAQLAAQMKSLIDPSLLEKNSQLVAKIKETIEPFGGQHAQLAAQMKSLIDPSLLEKNSQLVAKIKETIEPFGGQHAQLAAQMKSLIDPSLLEKNSQLAAQMKSLIDPSLLEKNSQLAAQMKSLIDPSLLEKNSQLAAQMKSLIDPSLLEKNSQLVAKIKETIEPFGRQHAQLAAQMKSLIDPSLLEKNSQLAAKIKETIEPFGRQHAQLAAQMKSLIDPSLLEKNSQLAIT